MDLESNEFQWKVNKWMQTCFGAEIAADKTERAQRFMEEALELVQSMGVPREDVLTLVDYTYGRPVGEMRQEVGGVMVTLAALCSSMGVELSECAHTELKRAWTKIDVIREKRRTKPHGSPLPQPQGEELSEFERARLSQQELPANEVTTVDCLRNALHHVKEHKELNGVPITGCVVLVIANDGNAHYQGVFQAGVNNSMKALAYEIDKANMLRFMGVLR